MATFDKLEQMSFPEGLIRVIGDIPKCNHYLISIVINGYLNLFEFSRHELAQRYFCYIMRTFVNFFV
jgi:hypothetical protein